MELTVRHQTIYRYASPGSRVALVLRLRPASYDAQQVIDWGVSVNGVAVEGFAANAWGDDEAMVQHQAEGAEVIILASGRVITSDRAGVVGGLRPEVPPSVFLRSTDLTRPDEAISALAAASSGETTIARLHDLSAMIRAQVIYKPGVTTANSTAAEALAMGKGVCQDQAHIFISAARHLGIPARYVVGYLHASDDADALNETHGWAEAYVDDLGWTGFDATNGVCTTDHYIRLCVGYDARDAAPIKGSVLGASEIGIDADVMISEAVPVMQQQ
jgi:transglutaminase-like putative cysteine protease